MMPNQQIDASLYLALPVEAPPQSNKKTLARVIITISIVLVLMNTMVYWAVLQYDKHNLMRKFTIIDLLDDPVDVLILGDSGVTTGINPTVIDTETGLTALNLSLNAGWTYYNDVWTLEYYLKKFGVPSYVILGHAYDNNYFTFDHVTQLSSVTHFNDFEYNSQYVTPQMTLLDQLMIVSRRLFPIYFRDQTMGTLLDRLSDGEHPFGIDEALLMTKGFSPKTEVNNRRVEAHAQSQTIRNNYEFSMDNLRVIEVFLDIVDTYDIPTYVFITPVHRWIGEDDAFIKATLTTRQFWDAKSRQYEQLYFNPEIPVYDSSDMFDSDHLNVYGAEVYTKYLVDWIWGNYQPDTLDDIYTKF